MLVIIGFQDHVNIFHILFTFLNTTISNGIGQYYPYYYIVDTMSQQYSCTIGLVLAYVPL